MGCRMEYDLQCGMGYHLNNLKMVICRGTSDGISLGIFDGILLGITDWICLGTTDGRYRNAFFSFGRVYAPRSK